MKIVYLTESQRQVLINEARLDYERIELVLKALEDLGYQKVEIKPTNESVNTVLVPTQKSTGAFLKNKDGIVTKSFDDLFFDLQVAFKDKLTSDHTYRDAILKHCIAHWAFPKRYDLWLGAGTVKYTDDAGNPMFNLA